MTTKTTTYKFKRGQRVSLDQIYTIQGLAGGDWWDKTGNDVRSSKSYDIDVGDECIITRNIEITITVKSA